jgi:glycosyltransferase involved in cell wall biosynthesis
MSSGLAKAPRLSICIPVFNRPDMVRVAIRSAVDQDIQDMEVVVVDNCSTDGTWEALQAFSDPRLRLFRNPQNLGLFGNFNRCLEEARGRYVRILCSDDRLLPGSLARELGLMEANRTAVLLSSLGWVVDQKARRLGQTGDHLPPGIYRGEKAIADILWVLSFYGYNPLNWPSGIMFSKEASLKVGRFDESIASTADVDYWLRLLRHGDLAVSPVWACEVVIHPGVESNRMFLEGHYMWGQFQVAEKCRDLLEEAGLYRGILDQLSARSVWLALKLLRMGKLRSAELHWALPLRAGVPRYKALWALRRHVALRLRRRLFGTCLTLGERSPFSQGGDSSASPGVSGVRPQE